MNSLYFKFQSVAEKIHGDVFQKYVTNSSHLFRIWHHHHQHGADNVFLLFNWMNSNRPCPLISSQWPSSAIHLFPAHWIIWNNSQGSCNHVSLWGEALQSLALSLLLTEQCRVFEQTEGAAIGQHYLYTCMFACTYTSTQRTKQTDHLLLSTIYNPVMDTHTVHTGVSSQARDF